MDYDALAKQFGGSAASAPPPVDYDALAKRFGGQTSGIPGSRKVSPADISVEPNANTATTPLPESSWLGVAKGATEAAAALATGAIGGLIGPPVGILTSRGKTIQQAEKTAHDVSGMFTYAPRSAEGQEYVRVIGNALRDSGIGGLAPGMFNELAALAPGAARQAAQAARSEANLALQPLTAERARQAEWAASQKSAQSWARATQIDAAKLAEKHGIALNPVESNPTRANQARAMAAGPEIGVRLARANESKWNEMARTDMGLPSNTPLDKKAFEAARTAVSGPYDAVKDLPTMQSVQGIADSLEKLRLPNTIGGEANTARVSQLVDSALAEVGQGMTGEQALAHIRQLRRNAQAAYDAQRKGMAPSPTDLAAADAMMGIANTLETLIENNIGNPKRLSEFRAARAALARTYDYERAVNPVTKMLDPAEVVKMAENGRPLSGNLADIAAIAGVFPDIAQVGVGTKGVLPRVTRAGLGGTAGFVLTGGNPIGALAGGVVGAVAPRAYANRMASPAWQSAHAIPEDFRMYPPKAVEPMPVMDRRLPVLFDPANAVLPPETRPNWVFGRPEPVDMPAPPNALALPAPSAESTMATVANQRQWERNAAARADAAAQAAADAAAAQQRPPTRAGMVYELDPHTGKLRPVDQGLKGATPETFSDFGSNLNSAAQKISSGQSFAMSAAEKVAWGKTKTSLTESVPGLGKLSNEQIVAKMQDRAWVADTVQRIRTQIATEARAEQLAREALANRQNLRELGWSQSVAQARADKARAAQQSLQDALGAIEDVLRQPSRKIEADWQGPKTREFNRNRLASGGGNKNALTD